MVMGAHLARLTPPASLPTHHADDAGVSHLSEDSESERLRKLEARIAAAKGKKGVRPHQEEHYSQAQLAWRMVTELVAGLGIGLAVGLGLDALFGTAPILMVLFIGLGLAAGINVMLRTAREVQGRAPEAPGGEDGPGDRPDEADER
jgi:ATP synthase protein I